MERSLSPCDAYSHVIITSVEVRVVKDLCSLRAHVVTIEKALYKRQPERRQELLLDTDKPLIALNVDLGCLDG